MGRFRSGKALPLAYRTLQVWPVKKERKKKEKATEPLQQELLLASSFLEMGEGASCERYVLMGRLSPPEGPVCPFLLLLFFLQLHPRHMEFPRQGVRSELQLPAYTTVTATWDPSRICPLPRSWILHPLHEARD